MRKRYISMNILLLSVGTRNKVVQYFKRTISGKVVATDMQLTAPALYEADKYYTVPRITENDYLDIILDICKKEGIDAVMSLIDPELNLLAANADRFSEIGVTIVGSSLELCERALDKWLMYEWLTEHGYKAARSYINKDTFYADMEKGLISFPVFVKPICGSASIAISKVEDRDTLEMLWAKTEGLMIQQYLKGTEIGADVYIDLISHEVVSIFTKKKILMRSGETDKAVSMKDPVLFALIERFVNESGFVGQIDVDIFDVDGEYYISEVNPRFGGGYPFAFECGCNHMALIENNIAGQANSKNIGSYDDGIVMMKYCEIKVLRS